MSSFLLPKDFTIPQLQKLYEDVLNKKFDSRNFRKHFLRKGVLIKTKMVYLALSKFINMVSKKFLLVA